MILQIMDKTQKIHIKTIGVITPKGTTGMTTTITIQMKTASETHHTISLVEAIKMNILLDIF